MALTPEMIETLVNRIASLDLYPDMRGVLLRHAGVEADTLPKKERPRDQIWSDVDELRQMTERQPHALNSFLEAVVMQRRGKPEVDEIQAILTGLTAEPVPPPAAQPAIGRGIDLTSVQYAHLHQVARHAVDQLADLAQRLELKSFSERSRAMHEALEKELYRVAITGKSRAGKSTLLNRLIERDICPIGDELTTAVPIIIGPGARERLRVDFEDRKSGRREPDTLDGPIHASMLAPYACQTHNPDNEKAVNVIEVTLSGSVLDLGVCYIDIPGIDDPSEEICDSALKFAHSAHALVVVVDVSPYAYGGFTVDKQLKALLSKAIARKAAIFIACSKADVLTREKREAVRELIQKQLAWLGLQDDAVEGVFVISAGITSRDASDTAELMKGFTHFEQALWSHLWETHEIGLRRLHAVLRNVARANEDLATIFSIRDKQGPEREALKQVLSACERERLSINEFIKSVIDNVSKVWLDELVNELRSTLHAAATELIAATPSLTEQRNGLPEVLRALLTETVEQMIGRAGERLASDLSMVGPRVDTCLAKLRDAIGVPGQVKQFSEAVRSLGNLSPDPSDEFTSWERWAGHSMAFAGTAAGVFALTGMPIVALLVGAGVAKTVSVVADLIEGPLTAEQREAKVLERLDERLDSARTRFERHIQQYGRDVLKRVATHLKPFFHDVRERLRSIEPPTSEERALHEQMRRIIEGPMRELLDKLGEGDIVYPTARPEPAGASRE